MTVPRDERFMISCPGSHLSGIRGLSCPRSHLSGFSLSVADSGDNYFPFPPLFPSPVASIFPSSSGANLPCHFHIPPFRSFSLHPSPFFRFHSRSPAPYLMGIREYNPRKSGKLKCSSALFNGFLDRDSQLSKFHFMRFRFSVWPAYLYTELIMCHWKTGKVKTPKPGNCTLLP
jgi:hypothetical protein